MESNIFQNEKISKAYTRLSLPLVFSMTVTLIYNLADTFFVAQTNDTNIVTGVSLSAPVFTLLMAFGNIFGQGGSSLISRYLGEEREQNATKVSAYCFYITILLGFIIEIIMLRVKTSVIWLLGADENSFSHASGYYTWLAIGAPALMLSFIHSNLLRSEGLSKESMAGTILGAVVNIILDPIFISGLGLGASGAAIATVIGYLCSDIFFAVIVHRRSRILSMDVKKCRISSNEVAQILKIGIPAAIVNLMQSVSIVLVNQFLLPYGNEKIAAMGIAQKISLIVILLLTGFAYGGQPLYGYYYGAGDRKHLRELFQFNFRFVLILALILSAAVFLAAPVLMGVFMKNDEIVSDGTWMLRWQVVTMALVGTILLFTIIFQSFGKALGSFILSISRQGVVFLVVLAILGKAVGYNGIIASQAVSDGITGIIAGILFTRRLRKDFRE